MKVKELVSFPWMPGMNRLVMDVLSTIPQFHAAYPELTPLMLGRVEIIGSHWLSKNRLVSPKIMQMYLVNDVFDPMVETVGWTYQVVYDERNNSDWKNPRMDVYFSFWRLSLQSFQMTWRVLNLAERVRQEQDWRNAYQVLRRERQPSTTEAV